MTIPSHLERGTRFLLARQGVDGLWRDFLTPAGEATEWTTGVVAHALHLAGAGADALTYAADALAVRQNDDGGWGYHEDVPTDADSTACVLLFLARMGNFDGVCRRAADCLREHQHADGGVVTYREPGPIRRFMGVPRWLRLRGWCSPHTEVTATAGRALAPFAPGAADAAWRYLRSKQRPDGSWSSYWWTSPHYATQQAVELARLLDETEPVARATGWASHADCRCAFEAASTASILQSSSKLGALQDADGGWPTRPILRIPLPGDLDPDRRRRRPRGIVVADQHRTFTTAACVAAICQY